MYIAILSIFITTLTFFSSPMTLSCFMCQSIGLLLCLTSNARHTFICSYSLLPHHSVSDSHAHTNSVYYTKSLSTSTYSLSPSHDLFLSPSLPLSLSPVHFLSIRRMNEIGQRRYLLNQSYHHALSLGKGDPSMKYEVQKFLLIPTKANDIHDIFLEKSPSGILNGLRAKRLRTGLAPFLMDSLVCVQLGNFMWSEECLGLTVGDLVFIKHSNRLRGAIRLCLPLNTILKGTSHLSS